MPPRLRVPPVLVRLDDLVVPRLLRALRRAGHGLAAPLRGLRRWEEGVAEGRVALTVLHGRRVVVLVAALLAFVASAVHLDRYPDIRRAQREAEAAAREQTLSLPGEPAAAAGDERAGSVTIGPPVGVDLAEYIADRTEALREHPAGAAVVAVVSFDGYRTADEVVEALGEDLTVHLAQYRVPAQGEPPLQTEVVAGDLVGSIQRARETARDPIASEVDEVEALLASGTVEDERFVADLEARLSELRAVKNLLDAGAGVVFAVVVTGPLEALQALTDAPGVRLVDPAPPGTDIEVSSFYGVRPEDGAVATYGRRG